jgi:septal ring factor EnvC (AmiA/AmiB activator)
MRHLSTRRSVKLAALCWLLVPALCPAGPDPRPDSPAGRQAAARLAAVRGRIQDLTKRRAAELAQRSAIDARLREADLAITAKRLSIEALRVEVAAVEKRRAASRTAQARTRDELDAQQAALAGQVVAAYRLGEQEQLKMLLHAGDPGALGRSLAYYGYFARARAAQIAAIRERREQLAALAADIEQQSAQLAVLQDANRRELAELERARSERAAALSAANRELEGRDAEMADLKRQEQDVQSLLAELASVMQDFPTDTHEPFGELRGRLPWPVSGRLVAHPHDFPNGVIIEAPQGAKVRAPYAGRVVYADWLPGLGLLLIIGHSGGYMSLYGHAEVLYRAVGDWVAPGEVVAGLGTAGGRPGELYFELRQGRKPLDAKRWLKTAP